MSEDATPEGQGRTNILRANPKPLAVFAFALVVIEGILVTLAMKAQGTERIVFITGMILVFLVCVIAVFVLGFTRPELFSPDRVASHSPQALSFERVLAELLPTIERLESSDYKLANYYLDKGDSQRLLDGLYSGLLYASAAVPTGRIESIYYGNLMEWDGESLRVRYFKGPYNDEIVTRTFPLDGPKQSVVSEALVTKIIQYRNYMEDELKERGESLLKAMVSIPVPIETGRALAPGMIAAINIDSIQAGVFPIEKKPEKREFEKRAQEVASLVRRVNALRAELTKRDGPI